MACPAWVDRKINYVHAVPKYGHGALKISVRLRSGLVIWSDALNRTNLGLIWRPSPWESDIYCTANNPIEVLAEPAEGADYVELSGRDRYGDGSVVRFIEIHRWPKQTVEWYRLHPEGCEPPLPDDDYWPNIGELMHGTRQTA